MKRLAFLALLALSACSSMPGAPGYVSVNKSDFDGSNQVNMDKAFIRQSYSGSFNSATMYMKAVWTDKFPPGKIFVSIGIDGVRSIPAQNSLFISVDGKISSFSSIDPGVTKFVTEAGIGGAPVSSSWRTYAIDRSYLEQMDAAKDVRIKLATEDGAITGFYTTEKNWDGDARPSMINFLQHVPPAK